MQWSRAATYHKKQNKNKVYKMHDKAYWVKVFADAIECGMRTVESVPEEYRKEVEQELYKRGA